MTKAFEDDLSFNDFDDLNYPRPGATDIEGIISRRSLLKGGIALGASALVMGAAALPRSAEARSRLAFQAVPANTDDTITVPPGFRWQIVIRWGDPLWSGVPDFDQETRGSAASQALAFGDNNDGMALFTRNGRNLLVVNNEYTNRVGMFGNRSTYRPETDDDIAKGKAGHGVSVVELIWRKGDWLPLIDSEFNRRITPDTPTEITGPARGHDLMKTAADPTGTTSLGTWNNCGNGRTPWGTYLACEENFNGYFSTDSGDFTPTAAMKRYGVGPKDWGYRWAEIDERFDVAKHPNESNRVGYVVEIDPFDPKSRPKKRTALGRFKHENAELVIANDGRVVVYLGDDERGEFLYRFISAGKYTVGSDNGDLLENGTLYVAKFNDDGSGAWMALTPETTGMTRAEISIHTRVAASKLGATTMDRPEWVAANPNKAEAYVCLTNNKNRGKKPNAGGDPTPVNGPNPRQGNLYGQILRWSPTGDDHTADSFAWDLFVMAGNPEVHSDARAGSANLTAQNMFNSPDGLVFDSSGLLWIQTDGKYTNEGDFAGQGNNQMLVGDPATGEIRRFMVGPNECEVTGLTWSADRRTAFVGIQHPGERGKSHFPDGGNAVPRSVVIAIRREDGGLMG